MTSWLQESLRVISESVKNERESILILIKPIGTDVFNKIPQIAGMQLEFGGVKEIGGFGVQSIGHQKRGKIMPKRTDIHKNLVIGSGPIVIGQAAEFDYAGTQACFALKEE